MGKSESAENQRMARRLSLSQTPGLEYRRRICLTFLSGFIEQKNRERVDAPVWVSRFQRPSLTPMVERSMSSVNLAKERPLPFVCRRLIKLQLERLMLRLSKLRDLPCAGEGS